VLARDARPPVLYLRAFADDTAAGGVYTRTALPVAPASEEEQLAHALNEIGPCVAVGRPGEALPALGASRTYVGDDHWKETVLRLMARARLVVFRAGATDGVLWEMYEAFRRLRPEQLLILVPDGPAQYAAFRDRAERDLGVRLPDYPDRARVAGTLRGIIAFLPGRAPYFLTFQSKRLRTTARRPLAAMFRRALRPVYLAHGVAWKEQPINWWLAYVYTSVVIGLAALVVLLAGVGLGLIEP
jgi:hypothetical protein